MAEAIVNAQMGDVWQAFSAGTDPVECVHAKAQAVLEEIGITHQGAPKSVDVFRNTVFDLVITVCDSAADVCPVWLGEGKKIHHCFPDPATTDDMNVFRKVRDDIEREITALLEKSC